MDGPHSISTEDLYGRIGTASSPIAAGAHVHTHNVASARGRGDLHAAPRSPDIGIP